MEDKTIYTPSNKPNSDKKDAENFKKAPPKVTMKPGATPSNDPKRLKRIHEILELAFYFSELNFHIVGDGELRVDLENKSPENVVFHGKQPHNMISELFSKMDLHILLSRSEGFPKVLAEASSFGCIPIIPNMTSIIAHINEQKKNNTFNRYVEFKRNWKSSESINFKWHKKEKYYSDAV